MVWRRAKWPGWAARRRRQVRWREDGRCRSCCAPARARARPPWPSRGHARGSAAGHGCGIGRWRTRPWRRAACRPPWPPRRPCAGAKRQHPAHHSPGAHTDRARHRAASAPARTPRHRRGQRLDVGEPDEAAIGQVLARPLPIGFGEALVHRPQLALVGAAVVEGDGGDHAAPGIAGEAEVEGRAEAAIGHLHHPRLGIRGRDPRLGRRLGGARANRPVPSRPALRP